MCSSPFPGNDRSIINGERERTCPLSFDLPERANCPSLGGSFENRGIFYLSFSMSVCLLLTEDSRRDNGGRDKKFTKHTSRAIGSRARAGQGTMLSLEVCRAATGLPQWGLESAVGNRHRDK